MLGNKFSIIYTGQSKTLVMDNIKRYGLESRLASIRQFNVPPWEIKKMQETALEEAKKAIEEDEAEVIIAYGGTYDYLKKHLNVPVLDPTICTLKITEALVRMGLTQSKKAFPKPRIPHTYYLSTKLPE